MKKIFLTFLIFSACLLAQWHISVTHNEHGVTFNNFIIWDDNTESELAVSITLDIHPGYSSIHIFNDRIKTKDNLMLYIIDTAGDYINYNVFKKDIEKGVIRVQNLDDYNRGDSLTKILVSAKSVELYNLDTDESLAFFELKGLKEILEKKLGTSYWYEYKLND